MSRYSRASRTRRASANSALSGRVVSAVLPLVPCFTARALDAVVVAALIIEACVRAATTGAVEWVPELCGEDGLVFSRVCSFLVYSLRRDIL